MVGLAIHDREARAAVGHCRHGFALFVMSFDSEPRLQGLLSTTILSLEVTKYRSQHVS